MRGERFGKQKHLDIIDRGYDFRFGYTAGYTSPCDFYSNECDIINKQCDMLLKNLEIDNCAFIPIAFCFWDPTPRF